VNLSKRVAVAQSVGIDIGGTKTLALAVSSDGTIRSRRQHATPKGQVEIAKLVVELYRELANSDLTMPLGIGVAGLVDRSGRLFNAPNLVAVDGFKIADLLKPHLTGRLYVDNDANCAAYAEVHQGALRSVSNGLLITLGTGIGGALLIDSRIRRGAFGMAGEPGHMIIQPGGLLCACGNRGCWEAYGSGAGLRNLALERIKSGRLEVIADLIGTNYAALTGELIAGEANAGDAQTLELVEEYASWVARGLVNCSVLLDPEVIVIGGGIASDWALFGSRIQKWFQQLTQNAPLRQTIPVEPAVAGDAAGALGAALMCHLDTSGIQTS
tara:strand:- start:11210 stop:12190 length:981 start_codon:yes stop_codon:yes gene_type:complete